LEENPKAQSTKTVGFSEPKPLIQVDPKAELDSVKAGDEATRTTDSGSDKSEIGETEAYDEEEDGVVDEEED
jgi:peroxin-2